MLFPGCKKCLKPTSKMGNYTNMYLSDILYPEEYNKKYGMMCAEHAGEVSEIIIKEKKMKISDWEEATQKARAIMHQELESLGKK